LLVKDIMVPDPLAITLDESTLLAFATMRERGMKRSPIVESSKHRVLHGYLRIENIMDQVVQRMSNIEREKVSSTSALTKELDRPIL